MRSSVLHYENGTQIDVIEFATMYDLNFNRGNIIKYIVRAGKKDDEVKDLEKAMDYLRREIETVRERRDKLRDIELEGGYTVITPK
jgi:hypothetical protein